MKYSEELVSVGIPTFNRAKGLNNTINCIINQTYKNLEIIISDNFSPNNDSIDVVKDFQINDNRIIFYRQEKNIGSIANFHFVLNKSNGKYFMWASDDDSWDKTFIEKNLRKLQNNNNSVVSMSGFERGFNNGKIYDQFNYTGKNNPEFKQLKSLLIAIYTDQYKYLKYNNYFFGLYRSNVLKETMNENYRWGNERDLVYRMAFKGQFLYVGEILFKKTVNTAENLYTNRDKKDAEWVKNSHNFRNSWKFPTYTYKNIKENGYLSSENKSVAIQLVFFMYITMILQWHHVWQKLFTKRELLK